MRTAKGGELCCSTTTGHNWHVPHVSRKTSAAMLGTDQKALRHLYCIQRVSGIDRLSYYAPCLGEFAIATCILLTGVVGTTPFVPEYSSRQPLV